VGDTASFVEIEHTADWAIRVRGATVPELFINAAAGMYALMPEVIRIK
jgi:SHS2 domain-containing protein